MVTSHLTRQHNVYTLISKEKLHAINPAETNQFTYLYELPGCLSLREASKTPWKYINEIQHLLHNSLEAQPYSTLLKDTLRRTIISKDKEIFASIPKDYNMDTVLQETWDMLIDCSDYYVSMDFYRIMPAEAARSNLKTDVLSQSELNQPCMLVAAHQNPEFNGTPLEWFMTLWTTYPEHTRWYINQKEHLAALERN